MTSSLLLVLMVITQADEVTPGSGSGITLDTVLQAHAATLDSIETADVTIAHTPVGKREFVLGSTDRWIKRGKLERFVRLQDRKSNQSVGSEVQHLLDTSLDNRSRTSRYLRIPDTRHLSDITLANQHGMYAYEAPFDRNLLEFQIYTYSLMRFAYNAAEDLCTLRQLVDESESATLAGESLVEGVPCYEVRVKKKGAAAAGGGEIRIFLDPSAGFLARQMIVDHGSNDKAGESSHNQEKYNYVARVLTFLSFPNGAYFPAESETFLMGSAGDRQGHNRFKVTKIAINQPIDSEDVKTHFPLDTVVRVIAAPVSPGTPPRLTGFRIEGKENSPLREFAADGIELQEFIASQGAVDSPVRQNQESVEPSESATGLMNENAASQGGGKTTLLWLVVSGILSVAVPIGIWRFLRVLSSTHRPN